MSILVIAENDDFAFGIRLNLEAEGFNVLHARTGAEGLGVAREYRPRAIIVDLILHDMSGFGLLKLLRTSIGDRTPVVAISSFSTAVDHALALQCGASYYVRKPFTTSELIAIIGRQVELSSTASHSLQIHERTRIVRAFGEPIQLTPKEFALLVALVKANGDVVSRSQLLEDVWGITTPLRTSTLDCHVKQLRRKLRLHGLSDTVRTVVRVGFAWSGPTDTLFEVR